MDKKAFDEATKLERVLGGLVSQLEYLQDCHDPRQIPAHIVVPPEPWRRFRAELLATLQQRIEETQRRFAAL